MNLQTILWCVGGLVLVILTAITWFNDERTPRD